MNYSKKILIVCLFVQIGTAMGQIVPNSWFEGWDAKTTDVPKKWKAFGDYSKANGKTAAGSAIKLKNDKVNGEISYVYQATYDTASYFYLPNFAFNGTPDSIQITYRPLLGLDTAYIQLAFTKAGEPFPVTFDEIQLFGNSGVWKTITLPLSQTDTSLHLVADSGWIYITSADEINGPYSSGFIEIDNIVFLRTDKSIPPLIPNNHFDNWDSYTVEQPLDWGTSYLFLKQAGIPITSSAKSTDKHSGNFAIKLQGSVFTYPDLSMDTIPGLAITLKNAGTATFNDIDANSPAFKVTKRYQSIRGFIKSSFKAADRAAIIVNFFHKDTIVGSALFSDTTSHNTWVEFAEDIAWDSTYKGMPDSATVIMYVCDSTLTSIGSLSSWVIFDDLWFDNYNVHAKKLVANSLRARLYPNPSNGVVTLKFQTSEPANASITIFAADGRIAKEINANCTAGIQTIPLDLSNLSKGIYFIKVQTPEGIFTDKIQLIP